MSDIDKITFSRSEDFFSNPEPITCELHRGTQMQMVYYNFNVEDSLAITPDKEEASLIIYVLEGELSLCTKGEETKLGQNDSIMFSSTDKSSILVSHSASKCLGISTRHSQHVSSSNTLMTMIDTVEKKDVYTYGHSRRVCSYANIIALELDHSYDIITLGNAADLHDVGKINVPVEILRKPGKLTKEEFDVIRRHSVDSYELVQPISEDIAKAVRQHHERLDGSGYPDGLRGEDVCLNARIIAIADVFDALTCKRVYNEPISFNAAIEYLESCGGQYDQSLVAVLKKKVSDGTLWRIRLSFGGAE